ncbi:MAG: aromatic amino acid lyase [Anaerolineae bacterium]|nr:aromatic amino acid lyase [Anaerolineae bacterium]
MFHLNLVPGELTLPDLRRVYEWPVTVSLDPACDQAIERARQTVLDVIAAHKTVYGVNTGFGLLANTRISDADLEQLQENLVLSHAAGIGPLLDDAIVRLVLVLKVNSLARGYSGVRRETIDQLIAFINQGVMPCVPSRG